MEITIDLLKKFCMGYSDWQKDKPLQQPFHHAGKTYATNRHVMVVLDDSPFVVPDMSSDHPASAVGLFEKIHAECEPASLPAGLVAPQPCKKCNGSGFMQGAKCETCDGDGSFIKDGWHYECKSCDSLGVRLDEDGDSTVHCPSCRGHGYTVTPIKVGSQWFDDGYLALVAGLPGVKFFTNKTRALDGATFTFDGGHGVLMPRSAGPDSDPH